MANEQEIQQLMQQYGVESEEQLLAALEQEQASVAPQETKKYGLNVKKYIEGKGGKLIGAENGKAIFETQDAQGNTVKAQFDPMQYITSRGGDPSQFKVELNTPEDALNESALGFADGIKFELHTTPESRAQYLKDRFGAENVSIDAKGAIKVKDVDGLWKRGDSTIKQFLAAEAPAIAASIPGSNIGANVGTAIGAAVGGIAGLATAYFTGGAATPLAMSMLAQGAAWGRTLGFAMGGSASYLAAKYGTKELAKQAGIISKEDVEAYQSEIGKEFVTQTAITLLTPPALKVAGKAISKTANATVIPAAKVMADVTKVVGEPVMDIVKAGAGYAKDVASIPVNIAGRTYNYFTNGQDLAGLMSKLFPKSKEQHWKVLYQSVEDMKAVQGYMSQYKDWLGKGPAAAEADPLLREFGNLATNVLKESRAVASQTYDDAVNMVRPYIGGVKININAPVENFMSELRTLGMLDDAGNFIRGTAQGNQIQVIAPGAERESLQHVYDIVQKVRTGESVRFDTVEKALKAVDRILDNANVYGSPNVISSETERILSVLRGQISTAATDGLRGKVKIPIAQYMHDAGTIFQNARQEYHSFRKGYDGLVKTLRASGESKDSIVKAIAKNLETPGIDFMSNFNAVTKQLGNKGYATIKEMSRLDAARGLASDAFGMGGQIMAPVVGAVTGGPAGVASSRLVDIGPAIGRAGQAVTRKAASAKATAADFFKLHLLGKSVNFFQNLKAEDKLKMLSDSKALQSFADAMNNSAVTYSTVNKLKDEQLGRR